MPTIDFYLKAEELGKDISNLSDEIEAAINQAVSDVAKGAYAEAIRLANKKLKTTRQDYVQALRLEQIDDNIYILSLDGRLANATEDGYGTFDMKPGLINGPKSKVSKEGFRYNTVPFFHSPNSKAPLSDYGEFLRSQVKEIIKKNKLNRVFKNPDGGKPLQGVVARVKNTGIKDLEGLVKIQKTYEKTTQSIYMTFRRVSSKSGLPDPQRQILMGPSDAWIHPGYQGAKIFPLIEDYIQEEFENIITTLL